MTEVHVSQIEQAICQLCIAANRRLPSDMERAIHTCAQRETVPLARDIMADLEDNLAAAAELEIPICQDTGMAVVFAEVGQDVHIVGGPLTEAVNRGVARGYTEGMLRCSVVADPLRRTNTNNNTPAILHTILVEGKTIRLTVAPKGFGSENMSQIRMLTPAAGPDDIFAFIVEVAKKAGSNPCPPMVLGVGIGGDFELCALLAKKALCRPLDISNPDSYYASMESQALAMVNELDIGPQGFGGRTTAFGVQIEAYPTHIAGLPVAVNVGCHVTRHATVEID